MMRKIYLQLNEEELLEAKENLESYLRTALEIAQRQIREEDEKAAQGGSTSVPLRSVEKSEGQTK